MNISRGALTPGSPVPGSPVPAPDRKYLLVSFYFASPHPIAPRDSSSPPEQL
jgi:hypothetical protein